MSSIVGPYAGVEADYRRIQIAAAFRDRRKSRRRLVLRKRRVTEPAPAIDWFGG